MEICRGAAGLSSALKECGFTVFAIDAQRNRHSPKVRPIVLELSEQHCQTILMDLLHRVRPLYIHLGLPYGTCSPAREGAFESARTLEKPNASSWAPDAAWSKPQRGQSGQRALLLCNSSDILLHDHSCTSVHRDSSPVMAVGGANTADTIIWGS